MKKYINKTEAIFFSLLLIISIIATGLIYTVHLNGPPIRSDGLGYYVYLPSIFIYNDLSLNKFIDSYTANYHDEKTDTWNGSYKYENTNNYLNKYPVGVAVMSSPFFLVAHAGTLVLSHFSGIPPDGHSDKLYHAAQAFSGIFYGILGLLVLKRILDKYFSQKVIYITLIVITFGTNLFHYFTYDAVFSHAYSFFLFTLFILLTIKWFEKPTFKKSLALGLTTGLITIVRPTNALIVLFFLFYGLSLTKFLQGFKKQVKTFMGNYKKIIVICLATFAVVSIQLSYWYIITNKLFVFSYKNEYFDFTNPQILNVLFSIQKGLFFWCPALLLSIPGIYFLTKKIKGISLALVLFLVVNIYVVSSWWAWSYGGSFGMRAIVDALPFFALPMAATLEKIIKLKNKWVKIVLMVLITVCCIFTTYMMIQYWRGIVPIDGSNIDVVKNAILNIPRV